ncbi:hypothetical protein C0993_007947 [Termitomyces sp. T159_Od127]|nr:hypothetical protein C0993_007947 [Termitomyces sp. T159_Od127]
MAFTAPGFQTNVRKVRITPEIAARLRRGEEVSPEEIARAAAADEQEPYNSLAGRGVVEEVQLGQEANEWLPETAKKRAASNSVHDAQSLLASYSMASANPTNHVARHLENMTLTAQPPSFAQPNYYMVQNAYPQGNPPPYTEYAQELAYIGSQRGHTSDAYWAQTRDDAVRLLGDHAGPSYSYQEPVNWAPQPSPHTNYQTNSLAQALFQHTAPSIAYPTPPPPGITSSSSSLAFALGKAPSPPRVYPPQQSQQFFNDFLEQKSRELDAARRPATPPRPPAPPPIQESPDPLALTATSAAPAVTPRKRKVYVQIESPAVKRLHVLPSFQKTKSATPQTPKASTSARADTHASPNTPSSHTPRGSVSMAYVAVPPAPWLTPTSSRKGSVTHTPGKRVRLDDTPDLGGYGSDDDDGAYSPMRSDVVKTSARRTGDRDDRGMYNEIELPFTQSFFVVENAGGDGDGASGGRKKGGDGGNVILRTFGKSAMRGLRLDALALIRSIFANHEDQRSWIIEEILSSLIKLSDTKQKAGQFRLRDGRSIRTVSALLLQLVQTSAHDVRIEAKKIDKARQNRFALKRQESLTESQMNLLAPEPFLDDSDLEEIRLYGSALDSAIKAAKTIVLFLTQRSGKGKATKNSNEAEYRAIFDNLISDLLSVLYWPEWPAASLLLSIASKFMASFMSVAWSYGFLITDNASKTIALDHLGVIAARIRSSMLKVQRSDADSGPKYKVLKPLDEIISTVNVKQLDKLLAAHKDIAAHLSKRSSEDQAYGLVDASDLPGFVRTLFRLGN